MLKEQVFLLKKMPALSYDKINNVCIFFEYDENGEFKKFIGEQINNQFEYYSYSKNNGVDTMTSILQEEFVSKFNQSSKKMSKKVYYFKHNDNIWKVNKFDFLEVITASVTYINHLDSIPTQILENTLMDVTDNKNFEDFNLSDNF